MSFMDPEEESSENSLGKGENAGNLDFSLFPQSYLSYQIQILPIEESSGNSLEKGENAGNLHFPPFPTKLSTLSNKKSP